MSEPERTSIVQQFDNFDEPVFRAEELPVDEPFFAPVDPPPATLPEPVFEAMPAQARGVTLPVDAPHNEMGWEAPTSEEPPVSQSSRRLGRTVPLWAGLVGVAVIVVAALWLSLGKQAADEPLLPTLPAAGVVGSTFLSEGGAPLPVDEPNSPAPTPTPETRFGAGQRIVVGNTNGQGIRLRSAPSTAALTLGIYNDGAPFLVLAPGGDYNAYPVEGDGYFWYRIRVAEDPADQLVGWAAGDFLVNSE